MRTTYMALATTAMILLAMTTFVRAEDRSFTEPMPPVDWSVMEEMDDLNDPLGLLWDEEGLPFDEEIIIKDGLIYT